jgi:hypothetical protein
MNFALSKKFSTIDFEEVNLSDLMLIGGGCGGGGGGGGSTTVTTTSVQQAQQTAASQPGANLSASASVSSPSASGNLTINFGWSPVTGPTISGTGTVQGSTGHVQANVNANVNTGGGFWSSVGSFFSWLFGSH